MKRFVTTLLVSIFLTLICKAQIFGVDDCMRYAVENSTTVGKQSLVADDSKANCNEAVASLFPALNASVSGATNFGRGIDPATNSYTTVTTFSNSYGVSAQVPLFTGLQGINTVRATKVAHRKGIIDVEIARDEVAMQTLVAYMNVVYYTQAVEIAREQLAASYATLQLAQRQFELGIKSATDVAEVESQYAGCDYLLTTEENNLSLAYIKLREVMNYPQGDELNIITDIELGDMPNVASERDLLDYALANNPRITAGRYATEMQRLNLVRSKGRFSPSLYLYGGYNTSYFIDFDNRKVYSPFGTQLLNNRGGYVQLALSIPIFNGLNLCSSRRRAENAYRMAQLEQVSVEHAVESEVAQTWQEMQGYGKQYMQGEKKEHAAQLAYDGAVKKFEKGIISALELQTVSNALLQAKSDKLHARLQYIIKSRMVEYYNGKPLVE